MAPSVRIPDLRSIPFVLFRWLHAAFFTLFSAQHTNPAMRHGARGRSFVSTNPDARLCEPGRRRAARAVSVRAAGCRRMRQPSADRNFSELERRAHSFRSARRTQEDRRRRPPFAPNSWAQVECPLHTPTPHCEPPRLISFRSMFRSMMLQEIRARPEDKTLEFKRNLSSPGGSV